MTIFSGYVFLFIGIIAGVSANSFAKISEGFTVLYPALACIFFMIICLCSLSKAMTVIPVGFTYATYGGLPITAIAIFGIVQENQLHHVDGLMGILVIMVGVIV